MLKLFAGILLEKQIVVICPNLGVLSAIVLSVIPMIRPFQWQSLLLPAGVQHKPPVIKTKASNIVRINVQKDQVKTWSLPQLPRFEELVSDLGPIHARLSCKNALAKRHPIYKCNEVQAEAAWQFFNVMKSYLESLCSDLRSHTITNVQSNNERVSLLLKDSFIDSFPSKDRPFVKLLSASACVALSLVRLVHRHYGGSADARTNRRSALDIFYGLALAEALLFLVEKVLWQWRVGHRRLLERVAKECHLASACGAVAVRRFFYDSYSRCLNGSIFDGLHMDLVSYANDLLTAGSHDEQRLGACVL
ncbi:hypothetical protein ABZP36_006315, partial [Zizania latifolia]